MSQTNRYEWMDQLRALAVLAVVMIHVSANVVTAPEIFGTVNWWIGNVFDAASRWCIPVFVMITGALVLAPERKYGFFEYFHKRWGRILPPLVFWTVFYLCAWWVVGMFKETPPSPEQALEKLLTGTPYYHMWYLYMLIGLYAVIPLLNALLRHMTQNQLQIAAAGCLIGGTVLDATNTLWLERTPYFFELFLPYIGFLLLGYILKKPGSGPSPLMALVTVLAGVAATASSIYLAGKAYGLSYGIWAYSYLSPTVICTSLGVFLLLRECPLRSALLTAVSPYVLGIYLIHPVFLRLFEIIGIDSWLLGPAVGIPITVFATVLASTVSVRIMVRHHLLKRVVQ